MALSLLFVVGCAFGLRWIDRHYGIPPAQAQEVERVHDAHMG